MYYALTDCCILLNLRTIYTEKKFYLSPPKCVKNNFWILHFKDKETKNILFIFILCNVTTNVIPDNPLELKKHDYIQKSIILLDISIITFLFINGWYFNTILGLNVLSSNVNTFRETTERKQNNGFLEFIYVFFRN